MDLVITGNEAQNQIVVGVESKDMDHHRSHREPGPITHHPPSPLLSSPLYRDLTDKIEFASGINLGI
ncbi:hypothetical protein Peur_071338 [Populus x canadensis]